MVAFLFIFALIAGVAACFITLYFGNTYDYILPVGATFFLVLIVNGLLLFLGLPTIGFFFPASWFFLIVAGAIGACIGFFSIQGINGASIPAGFFALFLVIYVPSSCEMCHSKDYRNLLGEVKKSDFSKSIPKVKLEDIRLVSLSTASTLAKKVLGQAEGDTVLGSQLKIDYNSACIQEVRGELWWIFPLDFSGFFKWRNRKVVPGYIRVNAQDSTKEAELIDADRQSGKKFKIRYTREAFFASYLDRKVYLQYPTIYNDDFTFEVDDNWRPYYVISATSPEIGFSGYKTRGVIIADPQTGKIEFRKMGNIPSWIDRVIPLYQAHDQMTWWGEYIHGWWNTIFSEKDIQIPTDYEYGKDLWFVKVGKRKYWFTGMTSLNASDQSLVGTLMMDTRTGKASYHVIHGTDENGVLETVDAALGADSARWSPTQPIPYNLFGVPTWVLPVVSHEGIFQRLAMVDMNNINTIAVDKNINRALEKYRVLLARNSSTVKIDGSGVMRIGPVRVLRVGDTVSGGNKIFYLMLEGYGRRLFATSGETDKTRLAALVKQGDMVTVTCFKTKEPVISINSLSIKNLSGR